MSRHRDSDEDRRRDARVHGALLRARLRPGYRLVIIDLSVGGALVEAARPLRPGSQVDVHLENDARRATLAARVLRCAVAAIHAESGVTYRAALSFNGTCDWIREALTPAGYGVHEGTREAIYLLPVDEAALPVTEEHAMPVSPRSVK